MILLLIILSSFFINSYKISDHLFFGHEQGRDAYAIREIYTLKHFPLIGTKTEIEGFFSPPWYYYLMAPIYNISNGNPIPASLFLIAISSTTPAIIFLLARQIFKSTGWGIAAAATAILSFELISYARWLANVTPATPLTALAFFFLYKYSQTAKQKYFVWWGALAIAASQFQITLIFQFLFVTILLLLLRQIKVPRLQPITVTIFILLLAFLPLVLFDLRHQYISSRAITDFVLGTSTYNLNFDPAGITGLYLKEFTTVAKRTLFNIQDFWLGLAFFGLITAGIMKAWTQNRHRRDLIFILGISLMSLGIAPFNIGLTQLYQGTAIGLILLSTFTLRALWTEKARFLTVILLLLLVSGWAQNLLYLHQNRGFFFATSESLNFKDQLSLLRFIDQDTAGQKYRFEAFTIPYLKAQGWQYLQEYFYPHRESKLEKTVYITIEKNVEPFWEKKWVEELGPTNLILEKTFGQIRLQKRRLLSLPTPGVK